MLALLGIFFRRFIFIGDGEIENFILAYPIFHNILIDTYKREILPTFMLEDGVYITLPMNWLKVEVISNIQCLLSTKKTTLH